MLESGYLSIKFRIQNFNVGIVCNNGFASYCNGKSDADRESPYNIRGIIVDRRIENGNLS
jgi:hypothetical protein